MDFVLLLQNIKYAEPGLSSATFLKQTHLQAKYSFGEIKLPFLLHLSRLNSIGGTWVSPIALLNSILSDYSLLLDYSEEGI